MSLDFEEDACNSDCGDPYCPLCHPEYGDEDEFIEYEDEVD